MSRVGCSNFDMHSFDDISRFDMKDRPVTLVDTWLSTSTVIDVFALFAPLQSLALATFPLSLPYEITGTAAMMIYNVALKLVR